MPISSQTPIIGYVANGVTKSFAFPFAILSADDLKVKVGADVVTTGFTIAGVGDRDGGSVTFTDAPTSLTPIILYREVTLDRTTDYQENGDLLAIVLDDDLDRIWMALQDQRPLADRAVRAPIGETLQQLPPASERALMALAFDAAGNPIVVRGTNDGGAALALDLMDTAPGKGAALVGYDDGTAQAVLDEAKPMANYTALRAYTGRATGVRITEMGLAGFFARRGTGGLTDNGGTIIIDAAGRAWERLHDGTIDVKWFGAKGNGVDDDTAAVLAAYNYCKSTTLHYCMRFTAGKYLTRSQFVFTDFYFGTMQMEGAVFIGASAATAYDSVFKVVNAINAKITGAWTVTASSIETGPANNPNLYENGAFFTAAPGGDIEPTKGIIAFVDVYGLKSTRVACGLKVGEKANDAQVAEITFHGYMSPYCPKAITVGGSQTVVNLNGCILSSNPVSFLTAPDYKTVQMDGGYINMVGGELTYHSDNTGPAVLMMPAESTTYGNPYPQIYLSSVLIETSATFAKIANPSALASPASYLSKISLVACGGYSGDLPSGSAFISVDDASYSGKITIDESCNFYRALTSSPRTGATINCSTAPNTKVSVGRRAFDTATGYLPWMQGVAGGTLLHGQELAIMAYANASSYTSPGVKNIVFNAIENTGNYARYQSILDATTGVLTLPSKPPSAMRIECSVLVGGVTGDIFIQDITNSRVVAFGQVLNGVANVCASIANPVAGQKFAVQVNLSGNVTFGGSVTNNLAVYMQN